MPCRCDFDDYVPSGRVMSKQDNSNNKEVKHLKEELSNLGKKYNELKAECDKVTQLLCYMCGTFVAPKLAFNDTRENSLYTGDIPVDDRLLKWFDAHNKWDNERTMKAIIDNFGSNPDQIPDKEVVRNWFITEAEKVHPLSDWHKTYYITRLWKKFKDWHDNRANVNDRIAKLEAELAELKKLQKFM